MFWPDLPKKSFSGLKQKNWTPHIFCIILHIQISLVCNLSPNWQFWFFGPNFHKKICMVKNWKSWYHHWIAHIQITLLVPNLCFNWQFWFFWPDLSKNCFSGLKQKKWTPHIFYIILHIQISLVRNFSPNWQFWFFGPNWPKKVFPVENRQKEIHHGILYIWISPRTKFRLILIILSFSTKFSQKRYFTLKTEQAVQGLQLFTFFVVNVNSTVAFKRFEDLKDITVLNIFKEKLPMSCLLGSFCLKIVS